MNNHHDWEACRYVLDDPTLDRQAFELRMLDDVDLALAVARAMSDIDLLHAASVCDSPQVVQLPVVQVPVTQLPVTQVPAGQSATGWHWTRLAALAAALLLSVGMLGYSLRQRVHSSHSALAGSTQQSLAESWLAIRDTELVDVSTNLDSDRLEIDTARDEAASDLSELTVSPSAGDDQDWLIDAAREFYAQGVAS